MFRLAHRVAPITPTPHPNPRVCDHIELDVFALSSRSRSIPPACDSLRYRISFSILCLLSSFASLMGAHDRCRLISRAKIASVTLRGALDAIEKVQQIFRVMSEGPKTPRHSGHHNRPPRASIMCASIHSARDPWAPQSRIRDPWHITKKFLD